ncbi:MAG: DJ-1/PfpI family protein, partial [bacterium]|nr:DJ-1/PfpI family protein [bacterium]MDW8163409.1 DJ-1/PfpI family protein [Candidatus Omnitrophota bacterium]
KNIFEKNGIGVDIASIKKGTAKGMLGLKTNVNLTIDEVKETDYDCIVLVGGIGVEGLFKNQEVIKLVQNFYKSKKIIGAICLAPGILANAGVLNSKKATGFHTVSTLLKEKGAIFTGKEVEVDGNIVTANGPGAAERFGNEILKLLKK